MKPRLHLFRWPPPFCMQIRHGHSSTKTEDKCASFLSKKSRFRNAENRYTMYMDDKYVWDLSRNLRRPNPLLRSCVHSVYLDLVKGNANSSVSVKDKRKDEDLVKNLVTLTKGFTGASIASFWSEVFTKSDGNLHLNDMKDIISSMSGSTDKIRYIDRSVQAHHESGHIVAGWFTKDSPITQVSLQTMDKKFVQPMNTQTQINDMMTMGLGGYCAERMIQNHVVSQQAHEDLQKVIVIALFQVIRFGMSDRLGPIALPFAGNPGQTRPYGNKLLKVIEEEILKKFHEALGKTQQILQQNKDNLQKVSDVINDRGSIDQSAIEQILGSRDLMQWEESKHSFQFLNDFSHKSSKGKSAEVRQAVLHEAGHAVVAWRLNHTNPFLHVSLKGSDGTYQPNTQCQPSEVYITEQIDDTICMNLGGRVSEKVFFNEINSGAYSDLEEITDMAYEKIEGKIFVNFRSIPKIIRELFTEDVPYSRRVADYIDSEVVKLLRKQENLATKVISTEKEKVVELAGILLQTEHVNSVMMRKVLGDESRRMYFIISLITGTVLPKYKLFIVALLSIFGGCVAFTKYKLGLQEKQESVEIYKYVDEDDMRIRRKK